jgi:hypothetical protein
MEISITGILLLYVYECQAFSHESFLSYSFYCLSCGVRTKPVPPPLPERLKPFAFFPALLSLPGVPRIRLSQPPLSMLLVIRPAALQFTVAVLSVIDLAFG